MKNIKALWPIFLLIIFLGGCAAPPPAEQKTANPVTPADPPGAHREPLPPGTPFRFTVGSDSRPNWLRRAAFQWTLQEMNRLVGGEGTFFIMVGDFDPPQVTDADLRTALGQDVIWYPVVGNHDAETPADMAWIRSRFEHLPFVVRHGPPGCETTTYSFDYGSAHFVVLNEYFTGRDDHSGKGDVCDALYNWLKADLEATRQPVIFVAGHEPAFPRRRHVGSSLDANTAHRDRFWKLLNERGVVAYFSGHTHFYGRMQQAPVGGPATTWQVDTGNTGQGRPMTFLDVTVTNTAVIFDAYSGMPGRAFNKIDTWTVPIEAEAGPVETSAIESPGAEGVDALQLLSQ